MKILTFEQGRSMGYGARRWLRKASAALLMLAGLAMAPDARAQEVVIAALGDSLTQGFGLPEADGFVPQLERWLSAKGEDVRVINAGVSGDTTAGGAARINWTLTDDVDALIVTLGGNDLLRGIDPAQSRANMDAILTAAADAGVPVLVAGMRAPGNYGPDYKRDFDAIYPELAEAHGALLYPFFLDALGAEADPSAARAFLQADGLHPNREGVAAIVSDIGPAVLTLIARARTAR